MPYSAIFRVLRGLTPYIAIVILLVLNNNLEVKLALADERLEINEARLIK